MKTILGTMTFSDQVDREGSIKMIQAFLQEGYNELDTAYVYNKGKTEELLGDIGNEGFLDGTLLAGKINPAGGGLTPSAVDHQVTTSLQRVGRDKFDLLYLHSPDLDTPIETTLSAVHKHYEAGRFTHFGLSNYAAWQVAEIAELCQRNGWMQPSVYQGMYNALTRDVESELFPCLTNYGMGFYVYNPLAGGMLSGKHQSFEAAPPDGRFNANASYVDRYWKQSYFDVINRWANLCREHSIKPATAALRWLRHHSKLASTDAEQGGQQQHAILLGASSQSHLEQNLQACKEDALPQAIVDALDEGWETVRPSCIKYWRP
ncbi:MAG: aldo/keto reductase [Gammaproteobacteria bacterium]|nr:aldo/keto reductase [Gammaproteobacteria bacterium]